MTQLIGLFLYILKKKDLKTLLNHARRESDFLKRTFAV